MSGDEEMGFGVFVGCVVGFILASALIWVASHDPSTVHDVGWKQSACAYEDVATSTKTYTRTTYCIPGEFIVKWSQEKGK